MKRAVTLVFLLAWGIRGAWTVGAQEDGKPVAVSSLATVRFEKQP